MKYFPNSHQSSCDAVNNHSRVLDSDNPDVCLTETTRDAPRFHQPAKVFSLKDLYCHVQLM